MTERTEKIILERIASLEKEVASLRQSNAGSARAFSDLPEDAVVGKDYVAYRFGCSERAVVRGEKGTDKLRRVSKKPLKFIKREVDAAWKEKTRPVKAKAAEVRGKARTRRYSVVGKGAAF